MQRKDYKLDAGLSERSVINSQEAAKHLGVSYSTLTKWRVLGLGPEYIKVGPRRIVYRISDLEAFLDERVCSSTSAFAVGAK